MNEDSSSVFSQTQEDWELLLAEMGQPRFRAKQIMEWLYDKRISQFDQMSNLSRDLRDTLEQKFHSSDLQLVRETGSRDSTRKFLFRLLDGRLIETVLIPASEALFGDRSDRQTLCVSSQVGCAFDCKFCASGLAGFTRNLTTGEIVSQLLEVERITGEHVQNIVFMGMGEPLANYRNLIAALSILNSANGIKIGARRITVSTSGLAPAIEKLSKIPMQIRLAISLHGATDEVREKIMPVNKKYDLERLFAALDVWRDHKKQKITFEFILIDEVNATREQAEALASRCRSVNAKVNLIPYNKVEGLPWQRPALPVQQEFLNILVSSGVQATLRKEKGHDIDAACGQLRLHQETAEGII